MARDEAATSILVYGEAIEYFAVLRDYPVHRARLRDLLRGVAPYRLTYPILERYAELRLALRPNGRLIGDVDTLIAAITLVHNLTVVTLDGDYQRVPGLSLMLLDRQSLL